MAIKHTPGPWRWRSGEEDYAALVSDVVGGPIIQTTHGVDPETPDAKLIAAAPDLADALQEMVREISAFTHSQLDAKKKAIDALHAAGRLP